MDHVKAFLLLCVLWGAVWADVLQTCSSDQFLCKRGDHCIPLFSKCDGVDNCADKSDERDCVNNTCPPTYFRCPMGRCIPKPWLCDFVNNCGDMSDEYNCHVLQTCSSDQFLCKRGDHCIPLYRKCDGVDNCTDKSDERDCVNNTCPPTYFRCPTGRCIPKPWLCDFADNCGDMSDEYNCPCPSHDFRCLTGRCIPKRWLCDRSNNCGDMSDEQNCPFYSTMSECQSRGLEVLDNQTVTLTCNSTSSEDNIYWALRHPNTFAPHRLGECMQYSTPSCQTCSDFQARYNMSRTPTGSTVSFTADFQLHDSAKITCSSFSNVTSVTCHMKVTKEYKIYGCTNDVLELVEGRNAGDGPVTLTCEDVGKYDELNMSIIYASNSSNRLIAMCERCNTSVPCLKSCEVVDEKDLKASRTATTSALTIVHNVRGWAGNSVMCMRLDNKRWASCKIHVSYPADLGDANVTLHGNWSVTGSVTVSRVFSSRNNITCQWSYTRDGQSEYIADNSTHLQLSEYKTSENVRFSRGRCVMMTSLTTPTEGAYNFSVQLYPGHGPLSAGSVTVRKPGELKTARSACHPVVVEWGNLACKCRYPSKQTPSPRARIAWDNATSPSPVLQLRNVSRVDDGRVYVCRSVWGPGGEVVDTAQYVLNVAYGPSNVMVTVDKRLSDDLETVPLTCNVSDVFPAANFTWSAPCIKSSITWTNSTCTVQSDWLKDPKDVTCLAVNSKLSDLNATGVLSSSAFPGTTGPADEAPLSLDYIVGAVAGVVVVTVIVVLIVVAIRRKKQSNKSANSMKKDANGDEFVEYVNEFYESSDILGTASGHLPESGADMAPSPPSPSICHDPKPFADDSNTNAVGEPVNSSVGEAASRVNLAESDIVTFAVSGPAASAEPEGNVYAKKKKAKKEKKETNPKEGQTPASGAVSGDVYTKVQKKKKVGKGGTVEKPDAQNETEYQNCLPMEDNPGELNMNVNELPPEPKPAPDDDDYNELHFHRPSAEGKNPLYSHLSDLRRVDK